MNNTVYASFRHYDHKGRRLSIFGWEDKGNMWIYVFTCSKQDQFTKEHCWPLAIYIQKKGIAAFKHLFPEYHPEEFFVPGNTQKGHFLQWCNNRYYKVKHHMTYIPGTILSVENVPAKLSKVYNTDIKYLGK